MVVLHGLPDEIAKGFFASFLAAHFGVDKLFLPHQIYAVFRSSGRDPFGTDFEFEELGRRKLGGLLFVVEPQVAQLGMRLQEGMQVYCVLTL